MADGDVRAKLPYELLLSGNRIRPSKVKGRSLDEEADADRGRVLFCAPFRRLQNKAQVFSLETNAAVRSRLTHSLEVSSIGRLVTQQAIKALGAQTKALGIAGNERAMITFVETACLLHDLGNPPFGHFGEVAIADWFHDKNGALQPRGLGGNHIHDWERHYSDFRYFDGNPQGLRICTRLQPSTQNDLTGLNLTATTLAATIKYPWDTTRIGQPLPNSLGVAKKGGYFQSELQVIEWIRDELKMLPEARHPLVYLMEAADDIAYCVSDIEDGIEKNLITSAQFATFIRSKLAAGEFPAALKDNQDAQTIQHNIDLLQTNEGVERATALRDFRSAVIRFLAQHAGTAFEKDQQAIIEGRAPALLRAGVPAALLSSLKSFAEEKLYASVIVRNRELTAQAVLRGLLDSYQPLLDCDHARFEKILAGARRDQGGRPIARDSSLASRISQKYLAVYREALAQGPASEHADGAYLVKERILRVRLILDHITGMTDEYALQSFQLISGAQINPYRN